MSDKRGTWPIGVGIKQTGGYVFVVETYFKDFKEAAEGLLRLAQRDHKDLARFLKALDSVL